MGGPGGMVRKGRNNPSRVAPRISREHPRHRVRRVARRRAPVRRARSCDCPGNRPTELHPYRAAASETMTIVIRVAAGLILGFILLTGIASAQTIARTLRGQNGSAVPGLTVRERQA